jgi:hypothetical protein
VSLRETVGDVVALESYCAENDDHFVDADRANLSAQNDPMLSFRADDRQAF